MLATWQVQQHGCQCTILKHAVAQAVSLKGKCHFELLAASLDASDLWMGEQRHLWCQACRD